MEFEEPLLEGKMIRRSHRFSAEVKLRSGEEITAHCAHGGQMEGLSDPGNKVLLSQGLRPSPEISAPTRNYLLRKDRGWHSRRPTT